MIEVRGPNVFKGYWRMPEKTAAELRENGFFITGDLGKIDAKGYVHIVGRGKDLIITGGYNVYPKEIETEIDAIPGVLESRGRRRAAPRLRRGRDRGGGADREGARLAEADVVEGPRAPARQVQAAEARAVRGRAAAQHHGEGPEEFAAREIRRPLSDLIPQTRCNRGGAQDPAPILRSENVDASLITAFLQVMMIDLVLAGDNAIVIGLAAAGLPPEQRRKAIFVGIGAATVLRIVFALLATQLLQVVGLLLAGGLLLLWVCWKMWQELHHTAAKDHAAEEALEEALEQHAVEPVISGVPQKTLRQAVTQIIIADVSMSLDNVLAVAGAAQHHVQAMIFGLALSVVLMGVASAFIARLLNKHRWIAYVGLAIILFVAVRMVYEGADEVLGHTLLPFHCSRVALPWPTRSADPAHGIGALVGSNSPKLTGSLTIPRSQAKPADEVHARCKGPPCFRIAGAGA